MAKVGCGTYHRSADGCYHTIETGERKKEKHRETQLSERAIRSAAKRESDAEVCRRCKKKICKGSPECIEKQRKNQEAERMKENKNGEVHE